MRSYEVSCKNLVFWFDAYILVRVHLSALCVFAKELQQICTTSTKYFYEIPEVMCDLQLSTQIEQALSRFLAK